MLAFDRVPNETPLPAKTEVVIIGGGLVGCAAALFLAEAGVPVVLCEKGEIGAEQSGRNWGWTRVMGRDTREIPLAIEALKIWRTLNARTGAETGFRQRGILYLARTRRELHAHEDWLQQARPYQVDSRMISPREIQTLLPDCTERFLGALYTPTDGRAEPTRAPAAVALAARRAGASIHTNCAVRGLQTQAGRVCGVVTEAGPIACAQVVLAGGAWSRLFCGNHGINLPQLKVLGTVVSTAPLDGPSTTAGGAGFAFSKRLDGGYNLAARDSSASELTPDSFRLFFDYLPALVKTWRELRLRVSNRFLIEWNTPRRWALDRPSPFEAVRILDPEPEAHIVEQAKRAAERAFPAFKGLREAERWAGLMDVTPDAVPVISPVAALPGFFIATGFSGHGFGVSPAAGKLVADMLTGATPFTDPAPYRFERFA